MTAALQSKQEQPPPANADDWGAAEMLHVFESHYLRLLRAMHLLVGATLPKPDDFRLDDATARRFLLEGGRRITQIQETTRQAVMAQIAEGQALGEPTSAIADRIRHLFTVTWKGRAEMIARTELQDAQLGAAYDRYRATNLVDRVRLRDGGTRDSDAFCNNRNGQVVPLSQRVQLAHPNCTLAVIPIVRQAEVAPPAAPALQSLGDALEFELDDPAQERVVSRIARLIGRVHKTGALPRLPVRTLRGNADHGSYRSTIDGEVVDLRLNFRSPKLDVTAVHELGHFLDHKGIGDGLRFASGTPDLDEWRRAIESSRAWRRLQELRTTPRVRLEDPESGMPVSYPVDRRFIETYALDSSELFARSYAQYIATKTGDRRLLAQIALDKTSAQQIPYPLQWEDDDFKGIGGAFDSLFKKLGWTR